MTSTRRCEPSCASHQEPDTYLGWHEWAEEMSKTHDQRQCEVCGLYTQWVPR